MRAFRKCRREEPPKSELERQCFVIAHRVSTFHSSALALEPSDCRAAKSANSESEYGVLARSASCTRLIKL